MQLKVFRQYLWLIGMLTSSGLFAIGGQENSSALTGILLSDSKSGRKQEFTRTIQREFSTTADGITTLYNKYGKVSVNTWHQHTVKIDVTIVVEATDAKSADHVFNRINVNFTHTTGYVKAETIIQPESQSWSWLGNLFSSYQDFKINYQVWMPITNALDLKNKYGDSFLTSLQGKLTAEIKYGKLKTEDIGNDCELKLGYGEAHFQKIQHLAGQIEYGNLYLSAARNINLETKFANLKIEKANELHLNSKYDDYTIGEVGTIRLQTKYSNVQVNTSQHLSLTTQYTDVKIGNIAQTLDADMVYGNLKIENVQRNFSDIRLQGKYTDFRLTMERGTNFRFDAEGSFCGIKYPTDATVRHHYEKNSWLSVRGFIGDEDARGVVRAKLTYGDLLLRHQ